MIQVVNLYKDFFNKVIGNADLIIRPAKPKSVTYSQLEAPPHRHSAGKKSTSASWGQYLAKLIGTYLGKTRLKCLLILLLTLKRPNCYPKRLDWTNRSLAPYVCRVSEAVTYTSDQWQPSFDDRLNMHLLGIAEPTDCITAFSPTFHKIYWYRYYETSSHSTLPLLSKQS